MIKRRTDHGDYNFIGYQFALINKTLCFETKRSLFGYFLTKKITGRKMDQPISFNYLFRLRTLSASRWAKQNQIKHKLLLSLRSDKLSDLPLWIRNLVDCKYSVQF